MKQIETHCKTRKTDNKKKSADEVTFICSKFVNCLSVNFPFYMHSSLLYNTTSYNNKHKFNPNGDQQKGTYLNDLHSMLVINLNINFYNNAIFFFAAAVPNRAKIMRFYCEWDE